MDEAAKAAQEVAKASGKAIDASREAGGFVAKFIEGPLSTAAEIVNDRLKYARWERQQRLMKRANEYLQQTGLNSPTKRIPLNVAVPLLEAATLEENDELQDIWAAMLVNAADARFEVEVRRMFISLLQDMGVIEVKSLQKIVEAFEQVSEGEDRYVKTAMLPEETEFEVDGDNVPSPPNNIAIALRNLMRLGCVEGVLTFVGPSLRKVQPTELGIALVKACTIKPLR